ncbi:MAG: hypothetical protein QG640_192, partial [Patescibacteria group bacterium]|nr:hypothetical protein [Patescibacteria group bacterium]
MTFVQRLTAVLSDQAEVFGLDEEDLILFGDGVYGGQEVNHGQLDSATERKITRLQTMLFQEEYDGQS